MVLARIGAVLGFIHYSITTKAHALIAGERVGHSVRASEPRTLDAEPLYLVT